jgi:protein-S-isoprenylcysteine O-methyltransferase Ste14
MTDLGLTGGGEGTAVSLRPWQVLTRTRLYDVGLRLAVAFWFMLLSIIFLREVAGSFQTIGASGIDGLAAARLVSRVSLFSFFTLIAWLTLVRARPIAQAAGLQPRLSALLGCYLLYALAFFPSNTQLGVAAHLASTALLLIGNVMAVAILIRLGRSFSIMAEARRLVIDGPYRIIRHPLYLAEQIAILGAFIQFASPWAALLVLAQFGFQLQRMRNEERVLLQTFPDYEDYMNRTARLIPGLW